MTHTGKQLELTLVSAEPRRQKLGKEAPAYQQEAEQPSCRSIILLFANIFRNIRPSLQNHAI